MLLQRGQCSVLAVRLQALLSWKEAGREYSQVEATRTPLFFNEILVFLNKYFFVCALVKLKSSEMV